jgi:2-polyprenyl-6-hydroxyphenyl methylase/3-demethylubiquinone-9 3-methyltransferase
MAFLPDLVDWLGGYPFEVATPEAIESFVGARGLALDTRRTCGRRSGCNEFVFRAPAPVDAGA